LPEVKELPLANVLLWNKGDKMNYSTLLVEKRENIGTLTFNRPEKLNAFNDLAWQDFVAALHEIDQDNEIRVLIITGAGRAFSAGLDLEEATKGPSESDLQVAPIQNSIPWIPEMMRNMKKPIIAALNGAAAGGGFSIALACDIRIASEEARLVAPFLRVGLVAELGSTYNLPRLVGIAKACEIIFAAKTVTAKEAKEIGLVNEVVSKEELIPFTWKMAKEIAQMAPIPLQLAKRALYQGLDSQLAAQVQFETLSQVTCFKSEDYKEGMKAFLEKRAPVFKGK
jgi:2-(1,2-epoxy-1,2-dihydrophenyl)acetyl-CoA isomerase